MSEKVTISDVAEALGVSKTTVSRAISGKGRIGADTKRRVLDYIEKHDYQPNVAAKSLATRRTYNLALILPDDYHMIDMQFFQKCMMGVCEMATTLDFDVVIGMINEKDITQLRRLVSQKKVEGVILTRTWTQDRSIEYLKNTDIPFVAIGTTSDPDVIQIDNDHTGACQELTSILLSRGMKRIALIGGNQSYVITKKRYAGFLKAFEAWGIQPDPDLIYMDVETPLLIENTVEQLVEKKANCILCMDDGICNYTLNKLRRMNIRIPEDMAVASFYNSSVLENHIPSITSLQFDARELGVLSCKILLDRIEGKEVETHTMLGYEVSMKESTKL